MPTEPDLRIVAASASEPWLVGSLALAATLTKAKHLSAIGLAQAETSRYPIHGE